MRRRASCVCKYFGDAESCAITESSFLSRPNATGNRLRSLTERLGTVISGAAHRMGYVLAPCDARFCSRPSRSGYSDSSENTGATSQQLSITRFGLPSLLLQCSSRAKSYTRVLLPETVSSDSWVMGQERLQIFGVVL